MKWVSQTINQDNTNQGSARIRRHFNGGSFQQMQTKLCVTSSNELIIARQNDYSAVLDMSQRVVRSKCPYSCPKKIYGALDLIENNRKKHSQCNRRQNVKKARVKKCDVSKTTDHDTVNDNVSKTAQADERVKTKLSQLLKVYGEQNSPAYRQGFDIKNYKPQRTHFPDLTTPAMSRGSVLRTSSHLSGLQDRPPSLSKTQTWTLPDINRKPLV